MEYDTLDDHNSHYSGLVMQLIRDNLKLWAMDEGGEEFVEVRSAWSDELDAV